MKLNWSSSPWRMSWKLQKFLLIHRDMFPDAQWMPETTDNTELYLHYIFSCTYKLFLLKETLQLLSAISELSASLLSCFRAFISKIRVPWTQVLWYSDSGSENQDSYQVDNRQIHVQSGDAGQRDYSHPGQDRVRQWEISSRYSE